MPASTVEFVANNRFAAYDATTANASSAGLQNDVTITRLSSGFVGVWNDQGILVAQRFDDSGARLGAQVVVGTASTSFLPSADAMPSGGFVVGWQAPDADGSGIYARIFGADGQPANAAALVNGNTTGAQVNPDVAVLSDGRSVVTWQDSGSIKARFLTAGGAPAGDEFTVGGGAAPSIDTFADGRFVIGYIDTASVNGQFRRTVNTKVFDRSGAQNGSAGILYGGSENESYFGIDVAVLSSGDIALTWASALRGPAINGLVRIAVQRADGSTVLGDTQIGSLITTPAVAALDGGGFAVVASNVNSFYSGYNTVLTQSFDNAGAATGSFQVPSNEIGSPTYPSITSFGSGDLAVGWVSYSVAANDTDILLKTYYSVTNGTAAADNLTGTAGNDAIRGTDGNDTIVGSDGDDVIDGGAGNDSLSGGAGNDIIDGGPGEDTIDGGAGNDIIYVDVGRNPANPNSNGDRVNGGEGFDTVIASVSVEFVGAGIEVLKAAAGTAPINLYGQLGTRIVGNDGDNILNFNGITNSVATTLEGGRGNDQYVVQSLATVIVEAAGGGSDAAFVSNAYPEFTGYTLGAGVEVETLSTASNSAVSGIALTGNQFAQVVIGDYGANVLTGGGMASANGANDVLIGLRGDDSYVVDSVRLLVIENANEGNDVATVTLAGSNFVLNADSSVETLRAAAGTDAINITGSPSSQTIIGNDGNNILSTGSGAADTLVGGLGDDIYRVFGGIDTIVETAGQGLDRVFVSGNSVAINAGASIEYLSVSVQADTGSFYLVGNEVTQVIVGNYGDNTLDGNSTNSGNSDTMSGCSEMTRTASTSWPTECWRARGRAATLCLPA